MMESRVCAPVAVFVYKRKAYAEKALCALRKNILADQTDLFIFSDGAKNEKDQPEVAAVQDFVRSFAAQGGFRSIHVNLASRNKGLASSIIAGVSGILEEFGRIIVLEDDLLTSRDYLTFMNDALDYYALNANIWSVSGYSPPLKGLRQRKQDVYFFYRASSWGWGTWKNRWSMVDWGVHDYARFVKSPERIAKLKRGGTDMPGMLRQQMEGEIDSWAIRWCYAQSMADMLTVYPRVSRVRNMGNDGSGTHTEAVASEFDTKLNDNDRPCVFQEPEIYYRLAKEFCILYDTGLKGKINRRCQRLKQKSKARWMRRAGRWMASGRITGSGGSTGKRRKK